jgi:hypothetical protein
MAAFRFRVRPPRFSLRKESAPRVNFILPGKNPAQAELGRGTLGSKINLVT